ncbi:MAG: enoyl-CoA hydratase [Gammaproteobacteria bacterium]|nr:enoyl-CoA hydratase [Gammaproteobacteria bacterium]
MERPVVELREIDTQVVQVTMQDKRHKNTFSKALISSLIAAFESIRENKNIKVVVLTGYDSYFSSGGTQDELLMLQEGNMKFTDIAIFSLALECPVPVIAAMQGHGIGGGFVMGLFCDFVILSRESIYTTNFMKYGFTPGMGATYILPKKLGFSLANEMLMNAARYRGEALKNRGIPFPVVPRKDVLETALRLASELAEKPRDSLIILKDHLVTSLRDDLPKVIEQEVIMHQKTFKLAEVKQKINELFGR